MKITCVHIHVIPGTEDAFISATMRNHDNTRRETGNIRFDFLQSPDDSARFQLIEVFTGEDAVQFHKTTAHYLAWRNTVAPMMAEPRQGIPWKIVSPESESDWL